MPKNNTNSKGEKRKKGETSRGIIMLLIEKPGTNVSDIAAALCLTYENVRIALKIIRENPQYYAARFGLDEETVLSVTQKVATLNSTRRNSQWRGKANWPASKTATKKSLTDIELITACEQHYIFQNKKYVIQKEEKDRAKVLIKQSNGTNLKTKKGRPTIPVSFTIN